MAKKFCFLGDIDKLSFRVGALKNRLVGLAGCPWNSTLSCKTTSLLLEECLLFWRSESRFYFHTGEWTTQNTGEDCITARYPVWDLWKCVKVYGNSPLLDRSIWILSHNGHPMCLWIQSSWRLRIVLYFVTTTLEDTFRFQARYRDNKNFGLFAMDL